MNGRIETGVWTSISVGGDSIGAFLNCGKLGIEAYDDADVLLGVFKDEDEAFNVITDCWDRKFRSNGGNPSSTDPKPNASRNSDTGINTTPEILQKAAGTANDSLTTHMTPPGSDYSQLETFVLTLFKHATTGNWASLRSFPDQKGNSKPFSITTVKLNGNLNVLIDRAFDDAERAARAQEKVVFCPPIATFTSNKHAREQDLAEGLVLSTECDKAAPAARAKLEALLGLATVVAAKWWRVAGPGDRRDRAETARPSPAEGADAKQGRAPHAEGSAQAGCRAADRTNIPVVHPIRWPGSLHRKKEPKLCRIVTCNPDAEIDLAWALEQLRAAAEAEGLAGGSLSKSNGKTGPIAAAFAQLKVGGIEGPPNPSNLRAPCIEAVIGALAIIPNKELEWVDWNYIGMAVYGATAGSDEGGEAFATWSAKAKKKNDPATTQARWEHYHTSPPDRIGYGTLVHLARKYWLDWEYAAAGPGQVVDGGVKLKDFYAYMPMHNYIFAPSREPWPVTSVNARIPPVVTNVDNKGKKTTIKASTWIDRNQPVEMMTWAPGMPMIIADRLIAEGGWIERKGVSCFNLYRAATIELGDASKAKPWLRLVCKVYPEDAVHIIKWFAWRVQRPEVKINHGLVLGSNEQGIGKDTILEGVKRAVGPWNFKEVAPKNMFDDFNPWRRAVILRVSEAKDMGDVSRFELYDGMKTLLAAPPDVLECNEKHIKQHYVLNCVEVVITTNYLTNGIYLPAEDRRHYVAWSSCKPADFSPDFWSKMWRWYVEGGDRHVAAFLSAVDISDFDPKAAPPKTAAFWSIVNANRTTEEGELQDVLDKLDNPDAVTLEQLVNGADYSLREWIRDRKNRKAASHRLETCGYRAVNNPVAKDGLWRIDERRQMVYAKVVLSLGAQQKAAETLQNEAAEKKRRKEDADNELDAEVERLLSQKIEAVAENKGPE